MAECVDLVAKGGKEVVPVFISIDPERDTVKRVKEYVKVRRGRSARRSLLSQPRLCVVPPVTIHPCARRLVIHRFVSLTPFVPPTLRSFTQN